MMQNINFKNPAQQVKPDIADMPQHNFKSMSLRDSLMLALPDFAVLALMILVFFIWAYVSFLRYDVR
jgi:ABC-type transport system involved in multi-copper enzyme maturation permease subunit